MGGIRPELDYFMESRSFTLNAFVLVITWIAVLVVLTGTAQRLSNFAIVVFSSLCYICVAWTCESLAMGAGYSGRN